ncbi:MAG: two-partner secretion domain-containing protein, partial [Planctomycetota bacterium]
MIEGENVKHGAAAFNTAGNTTTVTTTGMKTIIEYNRFNIDAGKAVHFNQLSGVNAATLNRIVQPNPSMINGALSSNGRLVFLNPAGVYFGNGSSVNATQLIASALNMSDSDFLAGNMAFAGGDGSVVNRGNITAESVYLVGKQVTNVGNIDCPSGHVVMAAGDRVLIGQAGGNVMVEIGTLEAPDDGLADVVNEGMVNAPGGTIVLAAAGDVFSRAVENVGVLSAAGGSITAKAGDVVNSGTMDVSGEEGGKVEVEAADRLGQFGTVNADGTVGDGGDIDLWAGGVIALGSESLTTANAGINGDGGEIVALSPETALFRDGAQIEAKGGTESGDGGFAEVSGWEHVEVYGQADVGAENGNGGTFLIDPYSIDIIATANNAGDWDAATWEPTSDASVVTPDSILTTLSANTVIIDATVAGAGTGKITVSSPIDLDTETGTLRLQAETEIDQNAAITNIGNGMDVELLAKNGVDIGANITATGNGNVTINADNDSTGTGSITNSAGTITMAGGDLRLVAGEGVGSTGTPIQTAGLTDIAAATTTGGIFINNSTSGAVNITTIDGTVGLDAGAGDISLTNTGRNIKVSSAIDTDDGAVDLTGALLDIDAAINATTLIDLAASGNIELARVENIINAGSGDVTLVASSGIRPETYDDAADNVTEISSSGTVSLSAQAIRAQGGNVGRSPVDISGADTLIITDTGGGQIRINEQDASTIESTEITVGAVNNGIIEIAYNNGDSVSIGDDHSLNNIDLDQAQSSFSYTATTGDISVGAVDVGAETVIITASAGSIEHDSDVLTAATANITASGDIGAVGDKIDTNVTTLQADAANIYISEADGITLDTLVAVTDIDIDNAAGDIIVDTVTAGGAATMDASAGSILNDEDAGTYLAAATADLDALNDIGAADDKLDTMVDNLEAAAANIYITEADDVTLNTLAADTNIDIDNAAGDIIIDTVSAGGIAKIDASAGSILNDGDTNSYLTAMTADIDALA